MTDAKALESISRGGSYAEKVPAKEKVPPAGGRRQEPAFRALLMTCGEAAQQSFRSCDGGSWRQMLPAYVEN